MNRATVLALLILLAPSASTAAACRIVSGGSLAFGPYDVLSPAPTQTQTDVTVTCDRDGGPRRLTLTMQVDQGTNGTSVNARRMAHTGGLSDALDYGIYRDPAGGGVWGTSAGVNTVSAGISVENKNSDSATFTLFGRIPAGQEVSPGSYSDTVQLTVVY